MSKKKKDLAEELIHLNEDEGFEPSLDADAFPIEMPDLELSKLVRPEAGTRVDSEQNTLRLIPTKAAPSSSAKMPAEESTGEKVKVSYGLPSRQQAPGAASAADSQLKYSEHLRIAQNKINDLEDEILKLRKENEDLATAAETYKKLNDEYYSTIEGLKSKLNDNRTTSSQESALLKKIAQNKDKEIAELRKQIEDYKSKIDNNFQRVRKREKDLEHRLEIAKIEEAAILKSKDQLILDLKRRIDELSIESDNFRKKSQENYQDLQKRQQVVRGAVRALRIALTKLEGDDDSDFGLENLSGEPDEA